MDEIVVGELVDFSAPPPDIFPWEKYPGEPSKWFTYFAKYFLVLGPNRSVTGAYRAYRRDVHGVDKYAPAAAAEWRVKAVEYDWEMRAQAWDEYEAMAEIELWRERRRELREKEWAASSKLIERADEVLDKLEPPTMQDTQENGRGGVRPTIPKLKPSDVVRFVETGSKVGRLASGMATDQTVTINVKAQVEEARRARWQQVAPLLAEVISEDEEAEGDEAVDEPPTGSERA